MRRCAPRRLSFVMSVAFAAMLLGAAGADATTISGQVLVRGSHPLAGTKVTLRGARFRGAPLLGTSVTNRQGRFRISHSPVPSQVPLYVTSMGSSNGDRRLRLMALAGAGDRVTVDEPSTVAAVYSLAQFLHGRIANGPAVGLQNAAKTAPSLVSPGSGQISETLLEPPNGSKTTTLATFRTLAALLGPCSRGHCGQLFDAAETPTGTKPRNTVQALLSIARHPASNVAQVYDAAGRSHYGKGLSSPPTRGLVLSLVHTAGGFDGPGRLAFDSNDNIWVTNNFEPPGTAAGLTAVALGPTGKPRSFSPVSGGGLEGAWWGIAVNTSNQVWLGNFTGSDPTSPFSPGFTGGNAVAEFSPNGDPLSPPTGFQTGNLQAPQGIAVDQAGNVLIANHVGNTVTRYVGGDPNNAQTITGGALSKPFGVAVDGHGNAWVTDNAIDFSDPGWLTRISPSGQATGPITGGGLFSPQGLAIDSANNVWVASLASNRVVEFGPSGDVKGSPIKASSIEGPWAVAVDGDDNVWVTSFLGQTLTELCGRQASAYCPPGSETGQPLSPKETGFGNGGMQHLTAVQIDQSGNVWVCNNWADINPIVGGNGLVELIGAAAPVKTPLIGPPQSP